MSTPPCEQITRATLLDYAVGELPEADAAVLEDHLFTCDDCGARAAELEPLLRAIRAAVRSSEVGGIVTDDVLNRLASDGVRLRTFTLSPGAHVPCAVWDGDELMSIRLRGDFGDGNEFTLRRRIGGNEISRADFQLKPGHQGEIISIVSAARIRQLPVVDIELVLTARQDGHERLIGTYTLQHQGSHQR
jgi:hypothetical protein